MKEKPVTLNQKNYLILKIIVLLILGFICFTIGYIKGVLHESKEWETLYDKHINKQWEIIEGRDSVYTQLLIEMKKELKTINKEISKNEKN